MNFILLFSVSIIWGSSFILMKYSSMSFSSVGMVTVRVTTGALVLALILLFRRHKKMMQKKYILPFILLALMGYVAPFNIMAFLISIYDSSYLSMVVCLVPIMTILVSIPMLGKYPNRYEVIGVFGGFFFLLLLFRDGLDRRLTVGHFLIWLTVPLSYAVSNTYVNMRFNELKPIVVSMMGLAVTGAFLLPVFFMTDSVHINEHFHLALLSLLVLGILCTGITTVLFYMLLHRNGPLSAGMVSYLIPIVALVWGWMDGEPVTTLHVISLVGIILMVGISQRKNADVGP